jgi:hypothetical protein
MSNLDAWAIPYFSAHDTRLWYWTDDGDVIAWSVDGTTIAFREEVAFVLEWLVPHGWPPFFALVWLLAACRSNLPRSYGDIGFLNFLDASAREDAKIQRRLREINAVVADGLDAIVRLPADLRASLKAKAVLAEVVFGPSSTLADATAQRNVAEMKALLAKMDVGHSLVPTGDAAQRSAAVDLLRSGVLTDAVLNDTCSPPPDYRRAWLALHDGLAAVARESLETRMRTGLDALPGPAELPDLPPSLRVRALIEQLRDEPEYAGFARLARDFMAALQLPRRLSEPDEMPIGGFADLANRGNLDNLLLSELAHDDLTLAVRIALNEALYLRREPPAHQPPSTLAVLLDCGVRVWGVPRVLATAIALALIAKSGRQEEIAVFRAQGETLASVDLLARAGLIAHLGALEPHAHPGAALAAFRAALPEAGRADAVLVTHRDVLADAAFRQSLTEAGFDSLYLAVVDREGEFELLRHPQGGAPLCRARIDVDDLWPAPAASAAPRTPLIDRAAHPDLPLILSVEPFPFLLPVRGKVQAVVDLPDGRSLCILQDRRLLSWAGPNRGARTVACGLPRGSVLWLGELSDGKIGVVKSGNGRRRLSCRVFLPEGDLQHSYDWNFDAPVVRVECRGNLLFAISANEAQVRDLESDRFIAKLTVSGLHSRGRYFRSGGRWCALAWTGQELRLEPIHFVMPINHEEVLGVFDRVGCEGPWCLTRGGDVFSHEGRRVLQLGPLRGIASISKYGLRLLVASQDGGTMFVDLLTLKCWPVQGQVHDLDFNWRPVPPTQPVRTRFDRIGILPDQVILLHASSGQWFKVGMPTTRIGLEYAESAPKNSVAFEPIHLPGDPGFSMKTAHWPDGRRAWLDDRGLLHLRGANRDRPEVSLVLAEPALALWSSDGLWYGSDFFLGDQAESRPREFWKRLGAFSFPVP